MIFMDNIKLHDKAQAMFMCDRCRKVFAFENGEKLYCPKCKENGYPLNRDPEPEEKSSRSPGKSRLIIPGGDVTQPIKE